jgi:large conductance mechanosensitive channel
MARRRSGGLLQDFGAFIMQGNVIDLAVAVIIGGAFGKIITSLTDDIITPLILQPALTAANVKNLEELTANGVLYGKFLASIINFLVIAFCIFLLVRAFENAKKRFVREAEVEAEAAPPDPAVVAQERLTTALDRLTQTMQTR